MARSVKVDWNELEKLRNAANLTQEELAAELGMVPSTLKRIKADKPIDKRKAEDIDSWVKEKFPGHGPLAVGLPPPPEFTRYFADIRAECGFIEVRGIVDDGRAIPPIPIADIYIPLTTTGAQNADDSNPPGSIDPRLLLLIGDPGSGKSTHLRWSAWKLTLEGATRFPILIRISELERHILNNARTEGAPPAMTAGWLRHFLAARSNERGWGLTDGDFHRKLQESATVFLDGLDEALDSQTRAKMARLLLDATRVYKNAHFKVTTRPAAPEFKVLADDPDFRTDKILNLDPKARDSFLRQWSGCLIRDDAHRAARHATDLTGAVNARPPIRRMASNPLMLTVIAVIFWNEKKLPEQRADLFESILKWLAKAREKPGRLPAEDCLRIVGILALAMQCHKGGRLKEISLDEAAEILKDEFHHDEHGHPTPPARRLLAALDFLEKEMLDSGIVVKRGHTLSFWHLTFQEYLAARTCRGLDRVDLIELLFEPEPERFYLPEWREVVLLLGSVLIRDGHPKLNAVFSEALKGAEFVTGDPSLAAKARAAGLLGAMLQDLRPSRFYPQDLRYPAFFEDALGIFDQNRAAGIELKIRVEAAEALGQAGDPRLYEDNWIHIAGGTFLMGAQKTRKAKPAYDPEAYDDEGTVREVTVEPFQIGRYPVTVQEFTEFVEDGNGYRKVTGENEPQQPYDWDDQLQYPNRPVVNVNWFAADGWCKWMTAKKGRTHRLPTEAEWEFAARGTEGRKYPWGNLSPDTSRANYNNDNEASIGGPTPVGLYPKGATPEGIDDMAGNVREWTADWYDDKHKERVVRGGCWIYDSAYLRAAFRDRIGPERRVDSAGFRCVREASAV